MKVLIFGLGSIAKKHIKAIRTFDKDAELIALRSGHSKEDIAGVKNIFDMEELASKPDFCLICNPTAFHLDAISMALALKIPLFIEKPVLMNFEKANELSEKIIDNNILTYVGYNLRFHPVLAFLKNYLDGKRVLEANIYCGSYLPSWRDTEDYSKQYSAIEAMGGGVHLDLSHEIDYALWLFGRPDTFSSLSRKISDLEIDSVDYANFNLSYPDKAVNISLNYFRRQAKRTIEIVLDDGVIIADLLNQIVKDQNGSVLFESNIDILETYMQQMHYFYKLIEGNSKSFNSFADALQTLKICLGNENTGE